MNHANNSSDSNRVDHDGVTKMAANPSPSTHILDHRKDMGTKSLFDYDRRVYLAKYYRTQLASGPAAFAAIVVGVSLRMSRDQCLPLNTFR